MKQQAEGNPARVKSEEDKNRYIRGYEEHEGTVLDKEKIEKNCGLRASAKLIFNSFWGVSLLYYLQASCN